MPVLEGGWWRAPLRARWLPRSTNNDVDYVWYPTTVRVYVVWVRSSPFLGADDRYGGSYSREYTTILLYLLSTRGRSNDGR